jgi:arsenate reductase
MKKIYYLSTCSTCSRIINELDLKNQKFEFQDIKTEKITAQQLVQMAEMAGSYEALFSRVALKYKALGLGQKTLTENDYKKYILEEYTFLKRPVIIIDKTIFVGNSKKTISSVQTKLQGV